MKSTMKLELRNGIAPVILTGEEIKGEGDVPIEVALVDDVTGEAIVDAPEASANIEFYLLNAEELIVLQEKGKLPVLAGNETLQLRRGVAKISNLKIRNWATKIKPSQFKLGARVVGAYCIKQAKTKTFTVKTYRRKYYVKHKNPSLSDEVSRLVGIYKGGEIHKRLKLNMIRTVEDFLIRHLIDQQSLESIVNTQPKNWKNMVQNAQACQGSKRVYYYVDPMHKTGVVFNILGHELGLCSGSHYYQTSTLSEKHKGYAKELLSSAYHNWKEVKVFDDLNFLHQHLYDKTETSQEGAAMVYPNGRRKTDPPYSSEGATAPSFPLLDPPPTALMAETFQTTATTPSSSFSFPLLDPQLTALVAQSFQTTATASSCHLLDPSLTALGAQSFQTMTATTPSFPLLDPPLTALVAQSFQTTATAPSFPLLDTRLTALVAQSFQTTATFPLLDPPLTALVAQSFQTTVTASSCHLLDPSLTALWAQSFQTMAATTPSFPLLDPPLTALVAQSFPTTATAPSFPLLDPRLTALVAQSFQTTATFPLLDPPLTALEAESFRTTNSYWENFTPLTDDEITTILDAAYPSSQIIRELMD